MLLRVTIFRGTVFLKGAAWSLFLIVPFSGRLRIYYEGMRQGLRLCIPFYLAQEISVTYPWIRMIYMLGVITLLIRLVRSMKRVRELIKRSSVPYVADYGRRTVFRERIYLTELDISPFAAGLLRPVIVLPEDFPRNKYVYFYYDTVMKVLGMGGGGECAWLSDVPESGMVTPTVGERSIRDRAAIWLMKNL